MKPSKAEKIALNVFTAGLIIFTVALLCVAYVSRGNSHSPLPVLFAVALCGYLILAAGLIAYRRLSKERVALFREEQSRVTHAAVSLPDLAVVDTSQAILTVFWSIDYKASCRLNLVVTLSSWRTWIRPMVVGVFAAAACYFAFGVRDIGVLAVVFITGSIVNFVLRQVLVNRLIKMRFPPEASVQNGALVVNSDSMHCIHGRDVVSYTWDALKNIRTVRGSVIIVLTDVARIIPDYAFRSREDAQAFVAEVTALKNGVKPPPFDWSSYKCEIPVVEGVWPPPIM